MVSQIEEQDSVAALARLRCAFEMLETRSVQPMNKDNDGSCRIAGDPPSAKGNFIVAAELQAWTFKPRALGSLGPRSGNLKWLLVIKKDRATGRSRKKNDRARGCPQLRQWLRLILRRLTNESGFTSGILA